MTSSRGELVRPSRLDSLTGLRFIAALMVFGVHSSAMFPATFLPALLGPGAIGVSFFYILSGFVLTWSSRPDDRARAFYRRRVARILPNYYTAWAIGAILLAAGLGHGEGPGSIAASFLLVQAWVPLKLATFAVNGPAWSLSCEAFFYALFPLLLLVLRRLRSSYRRPFLVGAVVAMAGIALVGLQIPGYAGTWAVTILPLSRLLEFAIGIVLAMEVAEDRWPKVPPALIGGGLVAAWSFCVFAPGQLWIVAAVVPFTMIIAAGAKADVVAAPSWFRNSILVRLGTWSYAFYLVHELVLRVARGAGVVGGWGEAVVWIPVLLGLSIAASWMLFTLIERPFEKRLRPKPQSPPLGKTEVIPVADAAGAAS
jgi:peptidoglycan/LPS O-acetylase OafA/YrhL